jgi:hypothetical protein
MNHPTQEEPLIVRSKKDYLQFLKGHVLPAKYNLDIASEAYYLNHAWASCGEPPSYPAFVWMYETEAVEEVGPTFPQIHVRWQTKAELKKKLEEFDK